MSVEDILKFQVLFYSPDGINSPVSDYLDKMLAKNEENATNCLKHIEALPLLVLNKSKEIKSFTHPKLKLMELKVKGKNKTEFRFFFIIEHPNLIVVYGFDKKTQKTEKRDVNSGVLNLEMYLMDKTTINPFKKRSIDN